MKYLKLTLLATLATLAITANTAVAAAPVYCPPLNAVHCDGNGNCNLDDSYQGNWGALEVTGRPTKDLMFGGILIEGSGDCMYGSSFDNAVDVYSKRSLRPDTKIANNWNNNYGVPICDQMGGVVADCPMLVAQ